MSAKRALLQLEPCQPLDMNGNAGDNDVCSSAQLRRGAVRVLGPRGSELVRTSMSVACKALLWM